MRAFCPNSIMTQQRLKEQKSQVRIVRNNEQPHLERRKPVSYAFLLDLF